MVHCVLILAVLLAAVEIYYKKHFPAVPFILLGLFACLRYMYGNDYANYYSWYRYIQAGGDSPYDTEYLFTLLNEVSPSFYILIAVTSVFFLYVVYRLITRNLPREYVWVAVFIFVCNPYLFLMNLSALRQCIAMCIFIVAVYAIWRRKLLLYIPLILLAALFHKSAILLLPVYFFATPKKVTWKWCLLVVAFGFVALAGIDLVAVVREVASYFDDKNYMAHLQSEASNSFRATVLTAVFFVYTLCNLPRLEGRTLVLGKLYLLGTLLGVLAFRLSMLTRVQMYFDIFSVVTLPVIFKTELDRGVISVSGNNRGRAIWDCVNRYVLPAMIVMIYLLRYYSFFTNDMWSSFVEYRTIFEVL